MRHLWRPGVQALLKIIEIVEVRKEVVLERNPGRMIHTIDTYELYMKLK